MRIVDKHEPREYTAISHNGGVVLCDSQDGAFLVLRFPEDLTRLKELLDGLTVHTADPRTESKREEAL